MKKIILSAILLAVTVSSFSRNPVRREAEQLRKELSWAINDAYYLQADKNGESVPIFTVDLRRFFILDSSMVPPTKDHPILPAEWFEPYEEMERILKPVNWWNSLWYNMVLNDPRYQELLQRGGNHREALMLIETIKSDLLGRNKEFSDTYYQWSVALRKAKLQMLRLIINYHIDKNMSMPTQWIERDGDVAIKHLKSRDIKNLRKEIARLEGIKPSDVKLDN